MNIRILVSAALAVLFAGAVANATDKDNNSNAAPVPASKTDVPKASAADGKGSWVGIIEDIQDVDTEKQKKAESEVKTLTKKEFYERSEKYATVGMAVGAVAQVALGLPNTTFVGWATGREYSPANANERDDSRLYLVTFKDEKTNKLERFMIYDVIKWNVGDKIKLSRNLEDPSKVDITVVEMGELSRYAAEKTAERDK